MILSDLSPVANHLWQSTFVAAMVWLLTVALRSNRAAVRYWIWLAASAKFLVPFSLLVSIGSQFRWQPIAEIARPQFSSVMSGISQSFLAPAGMPSVTAAPRTASGLPAVLLAIWLSGILLGLIFWLRSLRQIRAVVRTATPVHRNLPVPVVSSSRRLEPGVFGISKPVLVLPEGIEDRLTPAQLEAVLAHELCHVRRKDNLTATIQIIVETVFWFHPLVWWIRTRLVAERERACDEEVTRSDADPRDYAEGILNVCKFYLESDSTCISGVTGGNLKQRVERILARATGGTLSRTKKALLAVVSIIAVAGPLLIGLGSAPGGHAQSQISQQPGATAFEVASIKPNKSMSRDDSLNAPHGNLTAVNVRLRTLITFAYNIRDYQLAGGPSWLDTERYDIQAKVPPGGQVPESLWIPQGTDATSLRLQNLLAERFHLVIHHETKEMPIFALLLDKGGAKLQTWKESDGPGPHMRLEYRKLICRKQSMEHFASVILPEILGRPVVDRTGLTDEFTFTMTFEPAPPPSRFGGAAPEPAAGSTFVEALREQLGLKLESQRGPVDILVIDHVERPDAN